MFQILNLKRKQTKQGKKITKAGIKKENDSIEAAISACKAAEDKKGENILLLDVSRLTVIADCFVIVTAGSKFQINAVANSIEEKLSKLNHKLISKEGCESNTWAVLDFGDIIVHIMTKEAREYYKLERFWSNGRIVGSKLQEKAS